MGLYASPYGELASSYQHFAHVGLSALRCSPVGTSFDEPVAACGRCNLLVFGLTGVDRPSLAQCFRSRRLCHPPTASRIRGVDCGTERRALWCFFYAESVGLCALCPEQFFYRLPHACARFLRPRFNVQTIHRDASFRLTPIGLLAASTLCLKVIQLKGSALQA